MGTYGGVVEATGDPEGLGRLKVRAPVVYGPSSSSLIATADLPWALPAGLPAGGSPESGAIQWLPGVGDQVFVRFLDGCPEKPVWEWGNQSQPQARAFPYWSRQPGGYAEDGSAPPSSYLTRYGHWLEFTRAHLQHGTKGGLLLTLDDPSATARVVAPTTLVDSAHVGLGTDATDPVVRLSDLQAAVAAIVTQFDSHTHPDTGPPTAPMKVTPTGSKNTFSA